jgi:hypothetical protein
LGNPARFRRSVSLQLDWISRHALAISRRDGIDASIAKFALLFILPRLRERKTPVLRVVRNLGTSGSTAAGFGTPSQPFKKKLGQNRSEET